MKALDKENKLVLQLSVVLIVCMSVGSLVYVLYGNPLIESIYNGKSLTFLNELLANHRKTRPWGTLQHYFTLGRVLFSRFLLSLIIFEAFLIASLKYRGVIRDRLKNFFTAATHPVNLAVFRIALFYTIFKTIDVYETTWFSQLPADLRVPPIGVGWLLHYLPISETLAQLSYTLLLICCFAAMIGLFSRTSALLTVVLSFYVLGIPQFYGKVNHCHHLLWFAAIVAASRCGDTLSCDAIITGWKRAGRGVTDPPGPSVIYSLPLRFVWLLFGVIYFFPGFWKLWDGGLDWALSDNLKFIMYHKWMELGGWTPFFRIDRYPLLYKLGAVGTIAFETSFIFLIFSDRIRLLAPIGGIIFHNMTGAFMQITFTMLWRLYVVFFDWHRIFTRIGQYLFFEDIYIVYDGTCRSCRRIVTTLRMFDIFERIQWMNALDEKTRVHYGLAGVGAKGAMDDIHAKVGKGICSGFMAYRAMAARIPVLWPILPALYLWPIPKLSQTLFRHPADSRTDSPVSYPVSYSQNLDYASGVKAVTIVGSILVAGTLSFSSFNLGNGWPIAAYPSFDGLEGPTADVVEIYAVLPTREAIPIDARRLTGDLDPTRLVGLLNQAVGIASEPERRIRMEALWKLFSQNSSRFKKAIAVQFYKVTVSVIPEQQAYNPLDRKLLLEFHPPPG